MRKLYIIIICLLVCQYAYSQSISTNRHADYYFQIDRFDILSGQLNDSLQTALNGIPRKSVVHFLENYLLENEEAVSISDKNIIENISKKARDYYSKSIVV